MSIIEDMWLQGGVLHASNGQGYSDGYTGSLRQDGSFQLVWTTPAPAGDRGRIDGQIGRDNNTITGTFDFVFTSGCTYHMRIEDGHFFDSFPDGALLRRNPS
jgi:hypothetical protein